MPITNYPDGFANGVNIRGLPLLNTYGGQVYWVSAIGGADTGKGTENSPWATLDYAIGRCTAPSATYGGGDIIMVKAGHTETLTAGIAFDVAGVTVIGLGNGDARPAFTINAAVNGFSITADDVQIHNVRLVTGSSATAATRFIRIAASDIVLSGLKTEMTYDIYHNVVIVSGDDITIANSQFFNTVTTAASIHPQKCILNIAGTNVVVTGCRFNDTRASKTERWRMCVAGGALASNLVVENCTFICRGQATSTRSAGASDGAAENSPTMATMFCRAISPSANTAVGTVFNMKYGYQIECYDVAEVNKKAVISPTMA
jgi:hypothetical protein